METGPRQVSQMRRYTCLPASAKSQVRWIWFEHRSLCYCRSLGLHCQYWICHRLDNFYDSCAMHPCVYIFRLASLVWMPNDASVVCRREAWMLQSSYAEIRSSHQVSKIYVAVYSRGQSQLYRLLLPHFNLQQCNHLWRPLHTEIGSKLPTLKPSVNFFLSDLACIM